MDFDPPSAPLVPLSSRPHAGEGHGVSGGVQPRGALFDGRGPRGVGELLDEAIEALRNDFLRMTGMAMMVWFPVRMVVALIGLFGPQTMDVVAGDDPEQLIVFFVSQWGVGLWAAVTQTVALAFVSVLVFTRLHGDSVPVWRAFKTALRKLPALILIGIATTFAVGTGTVFCLAPGIWLAWKLQLCSMLPVLEGASIGDAFTRSWNLTADSFWRWLGLLATATLVLLPLQSILALPYDLNVRPWLFENTGWDPLVFEMVMVPLTTLIVGATSALMGAVHTVYYVDQRVRIEGLDLQVQLEAFESERPTLQGLGLQG